MSTIYPVDCYRGGEIHCLHNDETGRIYCCECNYGPPKMAPSLPACRMVSSTGSTTDEFGFPTAPPPAISPEDLELAKRFLGNLKDQTLSRSVHRVLEDLIGRLK